jgi:acetyl-CoA carboxylase beta subunit
MLGEQEALVLEVTPFQLHGVTYYDVTVGFPDRTVVQARLGAESVPDGLQPGEQVMATRAVNMVVSLRRLRTG